MNQLAIQLYDKMQSDLGYCRRKYMDLVKEVECNFQVAYRYLSVLKKLVEKHRFKTKDDEIYFFKNIKPKFLAEIQYNILLYHSQIFNFDEIDDQLNFWKREAARLEKFTKENKDFIERYTHGCSEYDSKWFVRNDPEDLTVSSHEQLVAMLWALERYQVYVEQKLKQIN